MPASDPAHADFRWRGSACYLAAERERGRITPDADVDTLAPTLIGAVHLLFAHPKGALPEAETVRKAVTTVMAGALPR